MREIIRHLENVFGLAICGNNQAANLTTYITKVTCKRCLKILEDASEAGRTD